MKSVDYLLPEMKYMVKLLKLIEKYSNKILKLKSRFSRIEDLSLTVRKIQMYNMARFSAICLYQDVCQDFYDEGKDVTYSFYQERFDEDVVKACFLDEVNCLARVKNSKISGWNVNPDDVDFSFNLNYFILETLGFGFSADFVRNCMDFFVPNDNVLEKYRKGVMRLFYEKKNTMAFSETYRKSDYDDLSMAISSVFSMKCGPNDYKPLFEACSLEELEKEDEERQKKRKNCISWLSVEDFEKFDEKFKFNPPGKDR